ncbi:hypothetical protein [Verrucomicrobium spinosum]|uniref:hypothetical protein n=1 Tax=Verrucomicrobium spinosum TaxID=2736 RepID=UPI00094659E9|nr:hypothetical protein [Verrucomicrobium spinosum]
MKLCTIALGLLFPFALGAAEKEQKEDKDKAPKLRLQNPGMEGGEGVPLGWTGKFGDCIVTRDTAVFHAGKASLCVDRSTLSDNRNACAHQMVNIQPASKITLSGWVKTEGMGKVNFAAQFFDERFTTNDCFPVKTLEARMTGRNWRRRSRCRRMPASSPSRSMWRGRARPGWMM